MNDVDLWQLRKAIAAVKRTAPATPAVQADTARLEADLARLIDHHTQRKDKRDANHG